MRFKIEYCVQWNYKPKARSLRFDINDRFGYWAEIVPGARGAFEVYVNEQLIFSKLQSDRFPNENEVIEFIEGLENVI